MGLSVERLFDSSRPLKRGKEKHVRDAEAGEGVMPCVLEACWTMIGSLKGNAFGNPLIRIDHVGICATTIPI